MSVDMVKLPVMRCLFIYFDRSLQCHSFVTIREQAVLLGESFPLWESLKTQDFVIWGFLAA